jgi:6-phosphogluconolactonase (cycloisomerase 2 family)
MRLAVWIIFAAVLPALAGCNGFFVPETSTGGGGGGGSTTTSRVYVANSLTNNVAGFAVGTNTLTAVTNSPLAVGYTPVAMVTTPNNAFLYVAGPGAIYLYTINSDGSLNTPSQGAAVAIVNVAALDVSPDGNWLFGLDATTPQVDEFQINQSTGVLTLQTAAPYTITNAAVVPRAIKVSPNGALVFAAVGTGGDVVFTLNTSTGALVSSQVLSLGTTSSDNALAIDSNSAFLYIARSGTNGGLAVYTIGAAGALQQITGSPFATGAQPFSVVLDTTGKYVYVANRSDGTISAFSIGTGSALTALSGSPYASGLQVSSLGVDRTGKYLLAAASGGSADLTMYSFDTVVPGKLNLAATTTTGTDPTGAVALAMSH